MHFCWLVGGVLYSFASHVSSVPLSSAPFLSLHSFAKDLCFERCHCCVHVHDFTSACFGSGVCLIQILCCANLLLGLVLYTYLSFVPLPLLQPFLFPCVLLSISFPLLGFVAVAVKFITRQDHWPCTMYCHAMQCKLPFSMFCNARFSRCSSIYIHFTLVSYCVLFPVCRLEYLTRQSHCCD